MLEGRSARASTGTTLGKFGPDVDNPRAVSLPADRATPRRPGQVSSRRGYLHPLPVDTVARIFEFGYADFSFKAIDKALGIAGVGRLAAPFREKAPTGAFTGGSSPSSSRCATPPPARWPRLRWSGRAAMAPSTKDLEELMPEVRNARASTGRTSGSSPGRRRPARGAVADAETPGPGVQPARLSASAAPGRHRHAHLRSATRASASRPSASPRHRGVDRRAAPSRETAPTGAVRRSALPAGPCRSRLSRPLPGPVQRGRQPATTVGRPARRLDGGAPAATALDGMRRSELSALPLSRLSPTRPTATGCWSLCAVREDQPRRASGETCGSGGQQPTFADGSWGSASFF